MSGVPRVALGIVLLTAGCVLGLYGLFGLVYTGENGGGYTYVTLAGHRFNAHWVGAAALVIACLMIVLAVRLLRRRRSPSAPSGP